MDSLRWLKRNALHRSRGYFRFRTITIGVASYGALGHVPPLDFQLVILGITRFIDSDESCARFLSSREF